MKNHEWKCMKVQNTKHIFDNHERKQWKACAEWARSFFAWRPQRKIDDMKTPESIFTVWTVTGGHLKQVKFSEGSTSCQHNSFQRSWAGLVDRTGCNRWHQCKTIFGRGGQGHPFYVFVDKCSSDFLLTLPQFVVVAGGSAGFEDIGKPLASLEAGSFQFQQPKFTEMTEARSQTTRKYCSNLLHRTTSGA